MLAPIATETRSWRRFAGIVALFTLLGPLVGAVGVNVLFAVLASITEMARGNFGDIGRLLIGGTVVGTLIALPIAYSFGIVPALGVGLSIAARDRNVRGISWPVALASAMILWITMSALATVVVPPAALHVWMAALLIAHLAATSVCAVLARAIFDRA